MTAVFGCLDHAELELTDGLNILALPNESGKSTWSEFLLAMLYGIDTRERRFGDSLPVKEKYRPWSGAPMEGRIDLEWNGKAITVERKSRGRVPMGEFRAYETESGLPCPELTAANCGVMLIGAEKGVFERSAFLRQAGLAVTPDDALERRLNALVTTGEEGCSFSAAQQRLRDAKNACRHNKTGELPRQEGLLADVEAAIGSLQSLHDAARNCRVQTEQLAAKEAKLSGLLTGVEAARALERRREWQEADAEAKRLAQEAEAARKKTETLPDEATLNSLCELDREIGTDRRMLPSVPNAEPQPPQTASVFRGLSAERIDETADRALREYDALSEPPKSAALPLLIAAVICGVLGLAAFFLLPWQVGIGLMLFCAGFAWLSLAAKKRLRAQIAANEKRQSDLLSSFCARGRDGILRAASDTKHALADYARNQALYQSACRQREQAELALRQKELDLREKLLRVGLRGDPTEAAEQVRRSRRAAEALAAKAESAARIAEHLRRDLPTVDPAAKPITDCPYTPDELRRQLARLSAEREAMASRQNRLEGQLSASGDPAELAAQKEAASARIEALKMRYAALETAMETLEKADGILRTRFAPQISRKATARMARMTGGRYDRILLDKQFSVEAGETGSATAHSLSGLSCGTADQLYFSVRLAICDAVLPPDAPLVLDDALAFWDDARAKQALTLLREEAAARQVLLFTCHSREKTLLTQ